MFSDRFCASLKPKTHTYKEYEKGNLPGFCIQVTPSGTKTFYLQFTMDGRRRFMSLGRYPAITLQQARERAQAAREEIERGNNPTVAVQAQSSGRQRTGTVRDAVELYIEDMEARGKTSRVETLRSMTMDVFPHIGDLLARDVKPAHIQQVLARVIARGVTREHNKVRSRLHAAFQFALHYDHDPRSLLRKVRFGMHYNPVTAVPKDRAAQGHTSDRALTFDEIKALWHADWHPAPLGGLRLIMALGGLRPVEVLGMRRSEVDLDQNTFTVPAERFKGRRNHVVAINALAKGLIEERIVLVGELAIKTEFLFPALLEQNMIEHYRVNSLSQYVKRCWVDQDWPEGLGRFKPYDLRRTVKTRMGEIGIDKTVRDRIQGHAMNDVSSKHYDRWDYLKEKREAADLWGAKLQSVIAV